jgi:hypothetical protein
MGTRDDTDRARATANIMIRGVDSTQDTDGRGDSGSTSREGESTTVWYSAVSREGVGGTAVWYSAARGGMSSTTCPDGGLRGEGEGGSGLGAARGAGIHFCGSGIDLDNAGGRRWDVQIIVVVVVVQGRYGGLVFA